jgi:hypothetical protein
MLSIVQKIHTGHLGNIISVVCTTQNNASGIHMLTDPICRCEFIIHMVT